MPAEPMRRPNAPRNPRPIRGVRGWSRAWFLALLAAPLAADELDEAWTNGHRATAVAGLEGRLDGAAHDSEHAGDWLRLAGWYEVFGRPASALDALESLAANGALPDSPAVSALRGRLLFRLDRFADALGHLPLDRGDLVALRCDAALALGNFAGADEELERLEALWGAEHLEVARRDGERLLRSGSPGDALARFDAALVQDSTDPGALFGRGRSLLALDRREEGLATLAEHRRILPLRDALDFAERSLALAPNHGPNHAQLAEAQAALGRLPAATASYERALARCAPEDLIAIALRAARHAEERLADPAAALELLDAAHARLPDVRFLVRAGDIARRAGSFALAAQRYEGALELRPGDPQIEARLEAARQESR